MWRKTQKLDFEHMIILFIGKIILIAFLLEWKIRFRQYLSSKNIPSFITPIIARSSSLNERWTGQFCLPRPSSLWLIQGDARWQVSRQHLGHSWNKNRNSEHLSSFFQLELCKATHIQMFYFPVCIFEIKIR